MKIKSFTQYGEKIAGRRVRANGHSGLICLPAEYIGIIYDRYIDRTSGVITLVPREPRSPSHGGEREMQEKQLEESA